MSRTNCAVAAQASGCGVPCDVCTNVTPAPSTPGIACTANSATSPQQLDDPAAARDDAGQTAQSSEQVAVICFQLCGGQFGFPRRVAVGLRVVVSHQRPPPRGEHQIYPPAGRVSR